MIWHNTFVSSSSSSGIEALSNLKFKRGTVDNIDGDLQNLVFELKAGNKRLMEEIRHITADEESLKSEVAELSRPKTMFQANIITLDKFVEYDKDFIIYTGFPNRAVFDSIYACLNPGSQGDNIIYWHSQSDDFMEN